MYLLSLTAACASVYCALALAYPVRGPVCSCVPLSYRGCARVSGLCVLPRPVVERYIGGVACVLSSGPLVRVLPFLIFFFPDLGMLARELYLWVVVCV